MVCTAALTQRIRAEVAAGTTVLALHESTAAQLTDVPLAQASSLMLVVGPRVASPTTRSPR
ncbi:putative methyltransferase [Mycobacterium xenopi 3993]|nr:putative methyltransferase [Mycobacterium xenopi 3993]